MSRLFRGARLAAARNSSAAVAVTILALFILGSLFGARAPAVHQTQIRDLAIAVPSVPTLSTVDAPFTFGNTANLNTARREHTATLLPNGKVLVAGGYNFSFLTSAELYDPASGTNGTWTATGVLNTARTNHTATLLPNGKVLVAGGFNGLYLTSAELYDPA